MPRRVIYGGMDSGSFSKGGLPEHLVRDLHRRLRRHGLWDCLLKFSPPLIAFSYLVFAFFMAGWIAGEVVVFTLAASLGVLLGLALHFGWINLSAASVARMIDDRVDGKDRFVTLTTIDSNLYPSYLLYRLRREATGFMNRISLKRDFPYGFRRSLLASLIGSIVFVLLSHIFLQTNLYSSPQATSIKELPALARELSQSPGLADLGRRLNDLESRIREQGLLGAGNEDRVQKLLRQIRRQLAAGGGSGEGRSDLLKQAVGTLQGLAESMERGQGMGGGLDARQPGGEEGEGKELTERGDGEGSRDSSVGGTTKQRGENSVQARMKKSGEDRGEGDGGGKDQGSSAGGIGGDKGAVSKVEAPDKGRKDGHKMVPRGKVPERYYKAGEKGEKGIEGARFVIVELPEAEGASEVSGAAKRGKGLRRPKVPVSNIPLPSRSRRDGPVEKQRIPLEYRGMLR